MIKILIFSALLYSFEEAFIPSPVKIEARKRSKGSKKRRRGGNGLR